MKRFVGDRIYIAKGRLATSYSRRVSNMTVPTLVLATVVLCGSLISCGQTSESSIASDNTKVNERDRKAGEPTADQQHMNEADTELTRKVREGIIADETLSTYAHNVKVISQDGIVTLKGPVRSEGEKKSVLAIATSVVGSADRIADELSVAP